MAIEHSGSCSLPPVAPFTPYEHCQPPHTQRVALPPGFIAEGAESEGSGNKQSPEICH